MLTSAEASRMLKSIVVRIVSSSGKVVYEQTQVFSGFDPLVVDFSGLAPGRYSITISYSGKTFHNNIVKV